MDELFALAVAADAVANGDISAAKAIRASVSVNFACLGCSRKTPQPPWRILKEVRHTYPAIERRNWLTSPFSRVDRTYGVPKSKYYPASAITPFILNGYVIGLEHGSRTPVVWRRESLGVWVAVV